MPREYFKIALIKMKDGTMLIGYGLTSEEAEADALDAGKKTGKVYKQSDQKSSNIQSCHGTLIEKLKEKKNGKV